MFCIFIQSLKETKMLTDSDLTLARVVEDEAGELKVEEFSPNTDEKSLNIKFYSSFCMSKNIQI